MIEIYRLFLLRAVRCPDTENEWAAIENIKIRAKNCGFWRVDSFPVTGNEFSGSTNRIIWEWTKFSVENGRMPRHLRVLINCWELCCIAQANRWAEWVVKTGGG